MDGLLSQDYLGNSRLFGSVGGLPSPLDWSAYQPVYDYTGTTINVPANTWQTYVNVTGKGFLKWVRGYKGTQLTPMNPAIRITIDGVPYLFQQQASGAYNQGNELNHDIPFKQSLKIEVENASVSGLFLGCDYLYLLAQSTPNPSKVTLLQQSQRNMGYLNTANTTLTDVINVTGSGYLLKAVFQGYYSTAASYVNGDLAIDGAQKMTDRQLFGTGIEDNKLSEIMGPIRFNSSLRVRTRIQAAGSSAICFVWYSLD